MRALHFAATSLIQAGEVCYFEKELLIYSLYICCCIPNTVYFLNPLLANLLLDVHQVVPLSLRPAISKASKQFFKILLGFKVVLLRYITNDLFGSLKKEGSRVEGGRVIQLPCLEIF